MDYNDNINLSLDIKNVGNDPASNVTVTLSSESEYVTITDNTATIASIAGDELVSLDKEFAFTVAPNVPDQAKIEFMVTCSDGTDTWETSFKVTANAPVLNINNVEVDGDVQAGGTATISLTFINEGNSAAYDIVTELLKTAQYMKSSIQHSLAMQYSHQKKLSQSVTLLRVLKQVTSQHTIGNSAEMLTGQLNRQELTTEHTA